MPPPAAQQGGRTNVEKRTLRATASEAPIAPAPANVHSRRFLVAGSLAATAALACVASLLFVEPRRPWVRIGSGQLALLGVTVGPRHRLITGKPWQRLALFFFPNRRFSGATVFQERSPGTELLVWMGERGNPSDALAPNGCCSADAVIIDEHGCRFPSVDWATPPWDAIDSSIGSVLHPSFSAYPRRGGPARCSIEPAGLWPAASLPLSLPRRHDFPVWRPEPYPIVRHVGDTEFTLFDIAPASPSYREGSAEMFDHLTTELHLRVRRIGGAGVPWEIHRVVVRDATGNLAETERMLPMPPGRTRIYGLCRHEPAWKLQVELGRREPVRAPPDYVWSCRVSVPPPGQFAPLRAGFSRPGARLELLGVTGKETRVRPGLRGSDLRMPHVDIRTPPQPTSFRLELLATRAGNGPWKKTAALPGATWDWCARTNSVGPEFELPDVRGPLELRLGIHTDRTVEFLAKPRAQ